MVDNLKAQPSLEGILIGLNYQIFDSQKHDQLVSQMQTPMMKKNICIFLQFKGHALRKLLLQLGIEELSPQYCS